MIKIKNMAKIKEQFDGIISMINKTNEMNGKDIVPLVKGAMRPEGQPMSKEGGPNGIRPALFEATYRGEVAGETENAKEAKKQMNKKELSKNEEEIVDRFARDFLRDISKGI